MALKDSIPYGSDVSAGTFECVDCGYRLDMSSEDSLPPCPQHEQQPHSQQAWRAVSGQGDAPQDPYPND